MPPTAGSIDTVSTRSPPLAGSGQFNLQGLLGSTHESGNLSD